MGAAKRSAGVDMLTGVNAVAPAMAPARKRVLSENMLVEGSGAELKRKRQDECRDLEKERCSSWRGSSVLSSRAELRARRAVGWSEGVWMERGVF